MGAFDKFDPKKIGFGKLFRSGKGYFNRVGLEGAFRELKDPRYGSLTKNLSSEDIKLFQSLMEKKLKSTYTYTEGFDYNDRRELNHVLEGWVMAGKITREDVKDFEEIIERFSKK